MKTCTKCHNTKDITEFYKKKTGKQQLTAQCKSCINDNNRKYAVKNKEKIANYKKEWAKENHEDVLKRSAKYYEDNKEYVIKASKKRRKDMPEHFALLERKRRENPNRIMNERISKQKRRALKTSTADGTITKKALENLRVSQSNKCFYCKCELVFDGLGKVHLDHYVPLSKGGIHSISNVVWSCALCNMRKNDKMPTSLMI